MAPRRSSGEGVPKSARSMSPGGFSPMKASTLSMSPGDLSPAKNKRSPGDNGVGGTRHIYRVFRSRSPLGRVEVPEDLVSDPWIRENFRPESWTDKLPPFGGMFLYICIASLGIMLGYALNGVVSAHQTALMSAVRKGDSALSVVQALLSHGQSCNMLEVQYTSIMDMSFPAALITPLYVAAEGGSTVLVEELLKHGASPNKGLHSWTWAGVLYSETPLFAAARRGHLSALEALMKGGASGSEGRLVFWGLLGGTSPLHAAVRQPAHTHGQIEIVQLLQTVDENAHRGHWGLDAQESLIFAAALGGDMRIFEALIAKRQVLDEARSLGAPEPLWWPSEGRFLGPMGLFGHTTPIYAAVRACNVEMVQRLLELGAAPSVGSRIWLEHASPLYAAAAYCDSPSVARALLSAEEHAGGGSIASIASGYSYGPGGYWRASRRSMLPRTRGAATRWRSCFKRRLDEMSRLT